MKRSLLLVMLVIATLVAADSMTLQAGQQEDPYGIAAQPASRPQKSTDTAALGAQQDEPAAQGQVPHSASALPLVAMIGLIGVGASLILRAMSRSTAAAIHTFKR